MSDCGIFYQSAGLRSLQSLPLSDLRVQVIIIDTSARVTLAARYINVQESSTPRCKYVFPVPANAAVCAFDKQVLNGRKGKGIVQDNELSREDSGALRAGSAAVLLNYVIDDIFTISVGSIPGRSSVTINITYVMSLHDDDNYNHIRFQLPKGVGICYGTPPTELESHAFIPTTQTKIEITAHIQASGPIHSIDSPSHPDDIKLPSYMYRGQTSRQLCEVKFRSNNFLDRDFILIVQADGLYKLRCFAEPQGDQERKRHYSLAMHLTLVPKSISPEILSQEYLFVLDRSSSMSVDGRIEQAKQTLDILLRMLPKDGTYLNMFTFDNEVSSLWPTSKVYMNETLTNASSWVKAIQTGPGSKLAQALQFALESRRTGIPTAVYVLTDVEVFDAQPARIVSEFVQKAPRNAPLCVFTLGIGDGISTATCEGIARAGNGTYLSATHSDQIALECVRLLKAKRTPPMQNVSIDWGIPPEYLGSAAIVTLPSHEPSRAVGIQPLANIQLERSPHIVEAIHAGTRIKILAIALKKPFFPQEVTVRGEPQSDGSNFKTTVPIEGIQLPDVCQSGLLIHTLAAWRLAQDGIPLPEPWIEQAWHNTGDGLLTTREPTPVEVDSKHSIQLANRPAGSRSWLPMEPALAYNALEPQLDTSLDSLPMAHELVFADDDDSQPSLIRPQENQLTISNSTIRAGRDVVVNTYIGNPPPADPDPLSFLQEHVAFSAMHDSKERYNPPRCHRGTRRGMLTLIDQWSKNHSRDAKSVLWLSGAAGAGKSAIAQTIVERWRKEGIIALAFFFWRTASESNHKNRLLPTLAYQLWHLLPQTRADIEKAIDRGNIFRKNSQVQLERLLINPLGNLPAHEQTVVIVIEGLDECSADLPEANGFVGQGHEDQQREILDLIVFACQKIPSLRIFVVSRPERQIRDSFGQPQLQGVTSSHSLNNDPDVDADIQLFLGDKLAELRRRNLSLPSSWPSPIQINKLVEKSSGQFIYPSTAVKYITGSRQYPVKSLDDIVDLKPNMRKAEPHPLAELDALYHYVLKSIVPESLAVVTFVFGQLCYKEMSVHRPKVDSASPLFFEMFLCLPKGEIFTHITDIHSILLIPSQTQDHLRMSFLHATFSEYLQDPSRSGEFGITSGNFYLQRSLSLLSQVRHTKSALKWIDLHSTDVSIAGIPIDQWVKALTASLEESELSAELKTHLWDFVKDRGYLGIYERFVYRGDKKFIMRRLLSCNTSKIEPSIWRRLVVGLRLRAMIAAT